VWISFFESENTVAVILDKKALLNNVLFLLVIFSLLTETSSTSVEGMANGHLEKPLPRLSLVELRRSDSFFSLP